MRTLYRGRAGANVAVRKVVERENRVLDAQLADVDESLRLLKVSIEHHLRDDSRTATLLLRLPGSQIVATGNGPRDDTAVRDAFDDLRVQLERYLANVRDEPAWRHGSKLRTVRREVREAALEESLGIPLEELTAEEAEAEAPEDSATMTEA